MSTCCQRHTTVEERTVQVVDAVTMAFLNEGQEVLSVREIAERVGCSPVQASHAAYGSDDIAPTTAYVDVHERNFNSVTHQRRCRGYTVTRAHLASIIRTLKEEKS